MSTRVEAISFPNYSGVRCLMMPYIQGDPESVPDGYAPYAAIIESLAIERGQVGYLTIDESPVVAGKPHRGDRAKHGRAIHTEAGVSSGVYGWGRCNVWGGRHAVTLDHGVRILLANSLGATCAIWDAEHYDTTEDGDIGHVSDLYPLSDAEIMEAGDVHEIGILTPHESLPVKRAGRRQFLRIVGRGVHGREPYFTRNPLLESA
ncbi:MAG: hypothetical protein EBR82_81585 [Caulobacteraceae bacterium]|nr:hypothetical protein [Caulobacteraceae bacterium]